MLGRALVLGWRNLWRNPGRSAITISALTLGTVLVLLTVSLMEGMNRDLVESGTRLFVGHIQVHAPHYLPERSIFDTLDGDVRELLVTIEADPRVVAAAPRAFGYALLSGGEKSAGVELAGIVPAREDRVSRVRHRIVDGHDLVDPAGGPTGEVVLGELLGRSLGVRPGDEVVALTQAADGSLGNEKLRVAGFFRSGIELLDGGLAFMSLADLQNLLGLNREQVHEVALAVTHPADARGIAAALRQRLQAKHVADVAAWPELMPELAGYVDVARGWIYICYLIVFVLAAIGITNTMLMAVFERMRELGVLAALGLRPSQIVLIVAAEAGSLAVVSCAAAAALGVPALSWLVHSGIDLRSITSGISFTGGVIAPVLRGAWTIRGSVEVAVGLTLVALAASVYPAARAARLDPAAALGRGAAR